MGSCCIPSAISKLSVTVDTHKHKHSAPFLISPQYTFESIVGQTNMPTRNVFDVFPASIHLIARNGIVSSQDVDFHSSPFLSDVLGCTGAQWTRAGVASIRAG